jgi:hypothetical protein
MGTTTRKRPTIDVVDVDSVQIALASATTRVEEIMLAIRPDDPDAYPLTPGLADAELAMRLIVFAQNELAQEIELLTELRDEIRRYAHERYWTHLSEGHGDDA